jgi:hypothetical protein
MRRIGYLFPYIYLVFLVPVVPPSPHHTRIFAIFLSLALAATNNMRAIKRVVMLLCVAIGTLIPFLVLVQSAVCSSMPEVGSGVFSSCVIDRALHVLVSVGLLSAVFLLAAGHEWRGTLVATLNGMNIPRSVAMIAIIGGAMIGEFRRATAKVHHAFTARGWASPSASVRNIVIMPSMLGAVWAAVLDGIVDRIRGQWASDEFWERYVPPKTTLGSRQVVADFAVLGGAVVVVGSYFCHAAKCWSALDLRFGL